ncbi:hypothetical protein [Nocardia bovistercoris]|uniref:hypothetical protein n=1 Tax=Nocardia bovistercoris TaxID=2785916 RepID=UPI0038CD94BC
MERVTKVTLTTELPIGAEVACALARTPELFLHLVAPILTAPHLRFPQPVVPGVEASARLWWFGALPTWRHHLRLVRLEPHSIYTNEWGGPVRTWNHLLTFEPIGESRCRYTDEIELGDGPRGIPVALFARLMFRHRHRRWRKLATLLANSGLDLRPSPTDRP